MSRRQPQRLFVKLEGKAELLLVVQGPLTQEDAQALLTTLEIGKRLILAEASG